MSAYLVFEVGDEEYAISVNLVREVYSCNNIVRVPNSHSFMAGVVSVRGKIIPVMDFGLRIGMPKVENPTHEVIGVEVSDKNGTWLLGLLVGSISGLKDSNEEELCPPPQFTGDTGKFVCGIFKESGCLIVDLDKVCRIE